MGVKPKLSELYLFVVPQVTAISRLLKSSAKQNTVEHDRNNEVIGGRKLEQKLRHRKEVAATKLTDAFRNFQSIKICTTGHTRLQKIATIVLC